MVKFKRVRQPIFVELSVLKLNYCPHMTTVKSQFISSKSNWRRTDFYFPLKSYIPFFFIMDEEILHAANDQFTLKNGIKDNCCNR